MKRKKPNPELTDKINPEWTEEMFQQARPAIDVFSEIMGEKAAELTVYKGRGRPKKANPKCEVKLRIDPDVLDAFKSRGKGWQTRMHHVLAQWAEKHLQT